MARACSSASTASARCRRCWRLIRICCMPCRANEVTRASTLTLVGHDGVAVAASNWDQPTTNVGEDYSYRPYYRLALAQGRGRHRGRRQAAGRGGDHGRAVGARAGMAEQPGRGAGQR
ncbi:hypothetical protein G6F46_013551 [Rhizopus delemar]|nr:hypothetical protein G6F46_013551 [Rhizopus delemar]